MGSLSRNKGRSFEQLIARLLTEATGVKWARRVRQHDGDSDIVTEDNAFSHLSLECKHATVLKIPEWWRQAQQQAEERRLVPVLIYRQTGRSIQVMLDAYHVNSRHWPVVGRHTVVLEWDAAVQWMREMIPSVSGPGYI